MRAFLTCWLVSCAVWADEVDLTPRSRRSGRPPSIVIRAEAGSEFSPYGYVGGVFSWMAGSSNELEFGAGGGFPGLQLGFAARQLFGGGGQFFFGELSLAGNTRVNRGASDADRLANPQLTNASSSLWTSLGLGFEQRSDFIDFSVAGSIVFTTASLTPHWSVHGGVGFGF